MIPVYVVALYSIYLFTFCKLIYLLIIEDIQLTLAIYVYKDHLIINLCPAQIVHFR